MPAYMEEYDRRRQMEALEDMFNTPYILEARRFANYDDGGVERVHVLGT